MDTVTKTANTHAELEFGVGVLEQQALLFSNQGSGIQHLISFWAAGSSEVLKSNYLHWF